MWVVHGVLEGIGPTGVAQRQVQESFDHSEAVDPVVTRGEGFPETLRGDVRRGSGQSRQWEDNQGAVAIELSPGGLDLDLGVGGTLSEFRFKRVEHSGVQLGVEEVNHDWASSGR